MFSGMVDRVRCLSQRCDHDWKGIYRWMDMPLMVQGLYFGESFGWWLVGSRCIKCGKEHRV